MPLHKHTEEGPEDIELNPLFSERAETAHIPRFRLPEKSMDPKAAYQIIHDELLLDGSARLNLATFVTTWMEPEADRLMSECLDKNIVDKDEYPQTAELERRCIHMLAELWHAPGHEAVGCSTTGSSEAAMLAGMAMLRRWRTKNGVTPYGGPGSSATGGGAGDSGVGASDSPDAGDKGSALRPNLVMGSNVQVCWDKFCRYWDVEARLVPMAPGRYHLTADEAAKHCDAGTIGVVAVMGSTQDGSYEPVAAIAASLDALAAVGGPDVPVHVDSASGGFIAPFLDPHISWDFSLPRVVSINSSGHKYGLVYPGIGWVLWRDKDCLPEDLVFHVNYLGGSMPTFALNFSRPGAQVVAQYYEMIRLGRDGYRRVQQASREVAMHLAREVARIGPFELISDGSELPVFAVRLGPDADVPYTVFDVSDELRKRGWQVPAYSFPPDLQHVSVLRVVVRNGFGRDLADAFLGDMRHAIRELERRGRESSRGSSPQPGRERFHH